MKPFLPFSLLALLILTACNKESLQDFRPVDLEPAINCIYQDCVSDMNPLLQETVAYNKSEIPLHNLQKAFDKEFEQLRDQRNFELDGYPAWSQLLIIPINNSFAQYLVPVFKADDDRTKALILFTHYLDHGVVDVEYVYRDKVKGYPAYNSLRLANKNGNTPLRDHTVESLVVKFSALDQSLFGNTNDDLLSLLDEETRSHFYNKDCQITTHYLLLECQDVVGGAGGSAGVLYTNCTVVGTETEVTVEVGCDGGVGGPTGPTGPSGPTTGGSGTGGVSVVNTDPGSRDNRCIEDEVGCEDDEDEDEEDEDDYEEDRIILDSTLVSYPCAEDIVTNFFAGPESSITEMINFIFDRDDNFNLIIAAGVIADNSAGHHTAQGTSPPLGSGIPVTFNGTIILNQDYLNSTNDYIYATLLHESLHAYFEGLRVYLGEENFNELYPLFAPESNSEDDQHEFMATNYVNEIARMLKYANPRLRLRHAKHLAWEGLQGTPAWEDLSEFEINEIGLTNRAARRDQDENDLTSYRFELCDD